MSLLTLMQDTASSMGITPPSQVVSSTDNNIVTLLALANTSGAALMKRYEWQELMTFSGTILTAGSIDIGDIATIFGTGFDRIVNQTFWDTSSRLPIDGPPTIQQWQQYQASNVVGPPYQFIIIGGRIKVGPTAIATNHVLTCYYITKNWCQSAGGTGQSAFAADTDTTVIPQELFKLDLIWRWKQKNGLSYAEDMQTAEMSIETYIGQNVPARVLFLGGRNILYPANIPEGYWPG